MRPAADTANGSKITSKNDLPAFTREDLVDNCIRNDLRVEDLLRVLVRAFLARDRWKPTYAPAFLMSSSNGCIIGVAAYVGCTTENLISGALYITLISCWSPSCKLITAALVLQYGMRPGGLTNEATDAVATTWPFLFLIMFGKKA